MREFNREFKQIFRETQRLLGKCEPNWTIAPIKIEGQNHPETICNDVTKDVTVRVTVSTITYPEQRTYQLTHESVHCLSPRNRRDTLFFEEGLANWYTLNHAALSEAYRKEAESKLDPLLAKPYKIFCELKPTYARVAALRKDCPGLDNATVDLIIKHFGAPPELATKLVERLPKDRPTVMM